MLHKCDKMFSLFERNVVLSKKTQINAITPYDVWFKGNVMSADDVVENIKRHYTKLINLPEGVIYSFCNPATEEWWYVGKYLVAYQDKKKMNFAGISRPRIVLLFNDNKAIVDENYGDFYFKFKKLLFRDYFSRITQGTIFTTDIGVLCYPERPIINKFECAEVKLPLVI